MSFHSLFLKSRCGFENGGFGARPASIGALDLLAALQESTRPQSKGVRAAGESSYHEI